jgi:O-antigen/teichoic acid export membrane protein
VTNEKSYWIRSGALTLLERFSTQAFNLVSIMILFRVLSKEDMGIFAIFSSIFTILEVGKSGLLQNAFVKYLTTSHDSDYKKISTASLVLNILTTVLIVVILLVIATPISIKYDALILKELLQLYCWNTVALIPFLQFTFTQQANLDFRGIFWSNFWRYGSYFLYIIIFFFIGWTIRLTDIIIVRAIGIVIGSIIAYFYAKPFLKFDPTISWKWVAELFHYGKYVMGTNLSTMIYKGTDRIMVGDMLGKIPAALYNSAIMITNLSETPTFSVAAILFPQSARKIKEGKQVIKLLYEKAVGAILTILLPAILLVIIAAEWIVWIISGAGYLEASNILRLTMFYGIFIPFAVQFGTVLDSTGKPKINFMVTVLSAILNIILNYFFIFYYGIMGAAWATLATYMIAFIFMQWYLYKHYDIKVLKAFYYTFDFYKQLFVFLKKKWSRKQNT